MALLGRDQILQARDIQTRDVEVPEWGGTVRLRALSPKEGNEWRRSMLTKVTVTDPKSHKVTVDYIVDEDKAEMAKLTILSIAIVDEDGNRLFTKEDVEKLATKAIPPINRLVKIVMDMSGLSQKAIEEAEKNSETSPSVSFSSE